jgi:hypothetical protein
VGKRKRERTEFEIARRAIQQQRLFQLRVVRLGIHALCVKPERLSVPLSPEIFIPLFLEVLCDLFSHGSTCV